MIGSWCGRGRLARAAGPAPPAAWDNDSRRLGASGGPVNNQILSDDRRIGATGHPSVMGALACVALLLLPARAPGQQTGSIEGWGSQVVGGNLTQGFVAIRGGGGHTLGLKVDGSVEAWGANLRG